MTHPGPRDLVDPFDRVVRDLRISVTDRCNFRCTYCMPEEGMQWMPRSEILTFEEIERLARICVERYGFDGIRLTGGEPTIRAHITRLVAKLAALGVDLAMTTNGATLRNLAHDLRAGRSEPHQHQPRHARPRQVRSHDAPRRAGERARAASTSPSRPGSIGSRSTRSSSVAPTTTRSSISPASAATRASRCASSSSCRSTPSDEWQRDQGGRPGRDRRRDQRRMADRARAGDEAPPRPTCGATSTATARSV